MKTPTEQQMKKWSIPSLASYLSYLSSKKQYRLAVLGILLTILSLIYKPLHDRFEKKSLIEIKAELALHQKNEEWQSMGVLLEKVDTAYHNEDWYNYYSGVHSSHSNVAISNLKSFVYYFSKIRPESTFFDKSVVFQLAKFLQVKNKLLFENQVAKLNKRLEDLGYNNPEYYLTLLILKSSTSNKDQLMHSYLLMKENYHETFTNIAGQITYNVKEVGVPIPTNISKLSKIYGVAFLYSYHLHENKSISKNVIEDIKTMFPNQDAFTFALMGMDNLHVQMNQKTRAEYRGFIDAINKYKS